MRSRRIREEVNYKTAIHWLVQHVTKRISDNRRAAVGEKAGTKATFAPMMPELRLSQMNMVIPIGDIEPGSFADLLSSDETFVERNEAMFTYLSVRDFSFRFISVLFCQIHNRTWVLGFDGWTLHENLRIYAS